MGLFSNDDEDQEQIPDMAPAQEEENQIPSPQQQAPVDSFQQANDLSKIQAARQNASRVNNVANFGNAISNMLGGSDNTSSNNAFFGHMREGAQNEVAQAEQARNDQIKNWAMANAKKQQDITNELNDPMSKKSQAVRDSYKKIFPDIANQMGESFDNLSAEDVNKYMSKPMELKMAADAKKDIQQMRKDQQNEIARQRGEEKKGKDEEKVNQEFVKFGESLKNTRGDPALASEQKKLGVAVHAKTMVNKNPKDLTPIEMQELAQAMAGQFSGGGQAAISTIEHISPQTANQDIAKAMSYVTGHTVAANSPEFVRLFSHMLDRQIETSQGLIADKMGIPVQAYDFLQKKDPIKYANMMRSAGLSGGQNGQAIAYQPNSVGKAKEMQPTNENGQPNGTMLASGIQEPDVAAYAKKHGISYQQAANLKNQRVGGRQ